MEIDPMLIQSLLRDRINKNSVESKLLTAHEITSVSDRVEQQYQLRKYQKRVFDRRLEEYVANYKKKQGIRGL